MQKGRAAGHGGVGAVMGAKNVKAVIFKGTQKSKVFDPEALTAVGREGYAEIKNKDSFDIWTRQGNMVVIAWANSIGGLPGYNSSQGVLSSPRTSTVMRLKRSNSVCLMRFCLKKIRVRLLVKSRDTVAAVPLARFRDLEPLPRVFLDLLF